MLGADAEAEDVLQDAYQRAFTHLHSFRVDARLSTWLTKIVLNEALGRIRRKRELAMANAVERLGNGEQVLIFPAPPADPEDDVMRAQLRRMVERAVDDLPADFRAVFVMRDIEELSVEETASHLGIRPETVKTRLHRARRLL